MQQFCTRKYRKVAVVVTSGSWQIGSTYFISAKTYSSTDEVKYDALWKATSVTEYVEDQFSNGSDDLFLEHNKHSADL